MKNAVILLVIFCSVAAYAQQAQRFSIEGHRGARGWVPENTIPSFKKALDMGADTLELDVVVSKDGKLVVSHEAWFSANISLDKDGNRIPPEGQREHNIYKMTYDEVKQYDVGSIGNKDFPQQEKMKVVKPLLKDVFQEIDRYAKASKLPQPQYNIEIKMDSGGDDIFQPKPPIFARLVFDEIEKAKLSKSVIVQSFDVRPLQELRKLSTKLPIALLVSNKDGVEANLRKLGFDPDTYSPHHSLVDASMISLCKQRGIKVVPWTVNEIPDFERMKTFDLDGIITDYPDRAVKIYRSAGSKP